MADFSCHFVYCGIDGNFLWPAAQGDVITLEVLQEFVGTGTLEQLLHQVGRLDIYSVRQYARQVCGSFIYLK